MMYTQNTLESFAFFDKLTPPQKEALIASSSLHKVKKGETVYRNGDKCDSLYLLIDGTIKISKGTYGEKEYISNITHAINIFGECCLFGSDYVGFDATSIDDSTRYYKAPISVVKNLMSLNFEFNLAVIALLGTKIARNEDRLAYFSTRDARARIIEFLKSNADQVGRKVGEETFVKHGLTQQDIANYTGTSRQTVTTVLNSLKTENQIYLRRKCILIRDIASLC